MSSCDNCGKKLDKDYLSVQVCGENDFAYWIGYDFCSPQCLIDRLNHIREYWDRFDNLEEE